LSLKAVGVGFAGLGVAGKAMIDHLAKEPALRLAAVQDANLNLAAAVAAECASPWHGQRFEDMLVEPSVEVVVISTPNAFHVPQAQAALSAGKQVLVQKPLATSAAGASATMELAGANRRLLFVDYSYRFLETVEQFRAALPEIGAVQSVSAAFHNVHGPRPGRDWFLNPALSGGGALIDLGVHMIDLVLWALAPREARLEHAELRRRPGLQVEHMARLRLQFDGVPMNLAVSWDAPQPRTDISVDIEGSRGRLRWNNVGGSFAHFQTWLNQRLLIEREITLRENTLHKFAAALANSAGPTIDIRVYDLLDQAYGGTVDI
jgi:predicted dehydrogenase